MMASRYIFWLLVCAAFINVVSSWCLLIDKRVNRSFSEEVTEIYDEQVEGSGNSIDNTDLDTEEAAKILHGQLVKNHKYPFMVSLQVISDDFVVHFCGGAIIYSEWVLTAAHCFDDFNYRKKVELGVNAGVLEWNGENRGSFFAEIKDWFYPPNYDRKGLVEHDIALVQLMQPLRWNKLIQPIQLPKVHDRFCDWGIIMGWGARDVREQTFSDELHDARITLSDLSECKKKFGPLSVENQLCLGGQDQTNACAGDSGGPFIQMKSNKPVLVGVASFGSQRCRSRYPVIFTRVAAYLNWINTTVTYNHRNV